MAREICDRRDPDIVPPSPDSQMPWSCNRCGRTFARSRRLALEHASRRRGGSICKVPHSPPPGQGDATTANAAQRLRAARRGRPRRSNWHNNLRQFLHNVPEAQRKWTGCRRCTASTSGPCHDCFFLNWAAIAQDNHRWNQITYGAQPNPNPHVAARRAARAAASSQWQDPRLTGGATASASALQGSNNTHPATNTA